MRFVKYFGVFIILAILSIVTINIGSLNKAINNNANSELVHNLYDSFEENAVNKSMEKLQVEAANHYVDDFINEPINNEIIDKQAEISSNMEKKIMDFISLNYPVIFMDFEMMMIIEFAYSHGLISSVPKGLNELVAYDFNIFDWNSKSDYIIIVYFQRVFQDGHSYSFYKYINGDFQHIGEAGYNCSLLRDSDGNLIIAEQETWEDVLSDNLKFSYLDMETDFVKRDTFINIINYVDIINNKIYSSWDEMEEIREQYYTVEFLPNGRIKENIKNMTQESNNSFIGWRENYISFIINNSDRNSIISLYNPDKSEIPYLSIDNEIYVFINNEVVFLRNKNENDTILETFPRVSSIDFYKPIFEYSSVESTLTHQ